MTAMRIAPAFRYRFRDSAKSALIFYCILVAIVAAMVISARVELARLVSLGAEEAEALDQAGFGRFSGYGFAAAITMFVFGITSIRADFRLFIQNGVGRKTLFATEFLSMLAISVLLAIGGEVLTASATLAVGARGVISFQDLYQVIYMQGKDMFGLAGHLRSACLNATLFIAASVSGTFVSLLFYRLNKVFTLIVAIGVPLFITVGIPVLGSYGYLDWLAVPLMRFSLYLLSKQWNLIWVTFAGVFVVTAINALLLRRAPVKSVK